MKKIILIFVFLMLSPLANAIFINSSDIFEDFRNASNVTISYQTQMFQSINQSAILCGSSTLVHWIGFEKSGEDISDWRPIAGLGKTTRICDANAQRGNCYMNVSGDVGGRKYVALAPYGGTDWSMSARWKFYDTRSGDTDVALVSVLHRNGGGDTVQIGLKANVDCSGGGTQYCEYSNTWNAFSGATRTTDWHNISTNRSFSKVDQIVRDTNDNGWGNGFGDVDELAFDASSDNPGEARVDEIYIYNASSNNVAVDFRNSSFRSVTYPVGFTVGKALLTLNYSDIKNINNVTARISADGGTNFQEITNGTELTITNTGSNIILNLSCTTLNQNETIILEDYRLHLEEAPDTITPPTLSNYSMISNGGCTNWNTNKSNPCSTSDTTPTVNFTTDENARCAIGTQDINLSNYTALGIDRNCTSGQGTTFHTCTLISEDELVYDTSYVYISCKDSNNNENRTSSSGSLALSVTGLESAGRNSIGTGIQNALSSGYTNYTDLQIYARNLSNGQVKGAFDMAAKKGSRMWAFNRIGVSDSHVNMFNLTPVLYTLELVNKTSTNITKEVELLINATK